MRKSLLAAVTIWLMHAAAPLFGTPPVVAFTQSATTLAAYDFVEVTVKVAGSDVGNPFTNASVNGWFEASGTSKRWQVDGFCDSPDGTVYRIRFVPPSAGDYKYLGFLSPGCV